MSSTLQMRTKSGFSLIEIMIAIAIIAVMAAVVGPRLFTFLSKGKERATESNIQALGSAVNSYYSHVGKYPTSLEDLVQKPDDLSERKWGGPYISSDELPKDGWGDDFIFEVVDPKRGKFRIYSVNMEESEE